MKIELFVTPDCPYCPTAAAVAEEVLKTYPYVEFEILNAKQHKELVGVYHLTSVPAFVVDGVLWRVGIPDAQDMVHLIEKGFDYTPMDE